MFKLVLFYMSGQGSDRTEQKSMDSVAILRSRRDVELLGHAKLIASSHYTRFEVRPVTLEDLQTLAYSANKAAAQEIARTAIKAAIYHGGLRQPEVNELLSLGQIAEHAADGYYSRNEYDSGNPNVLISDILESVKPIDYGLVNPETGELESLADLLGQ